MVEWTCRAHSFGRRVSSVSHAFNHLYEMVSMFGFTFAGCRGAGPGSDSCILDVSQTEKRRPSRGSDWETIRPRARE